MLHCAISRLSSSVVPQILSGNKSLKEHDPQLHGLINQELRRQIEGLELIASENFTSRSVLECLGSILTNKYAEGLPGNRYYGGAQVIDKIEDLCRDRALQAFRCDPNIWGVNVQPYSGSPANFAAYTAVLQPHERLMGLSLQAGGHLTHGFYRPKKRVSATSVYFESLPYSLTPEGYIDYDEVDKLANIFCPRLIIAGASAYPRDWNYRRFREICDKVGAYLLVDMAHISALIATQEHNNPFEHADIITSTTHKTLRGPRSGIIFFKKEVQLGGPTKQETVLLEDKINNAVFPSLQGGPHEHQIAALATQLKDVMSPEFKEYVKQVKRNCKALAEGLLKRSENNKLVSGGTDNHLILWNLNPRGITGSKLEKILEMCHISTNKNSVIGDKSPANPGGLRVGSAALTSRGFMENDFDTVAEFLERSVCLAQKLQKNTNSKSLVEFTKQCLGDKEVESLGEDVKAFARNFPFPGLENPFPLRN